MPAQIIKRDGRVEPFNRQKIINAITHAMLRAKQSDMAAVERIADEIAMNQSEALNVEEIQDMVELKLMKSSLKPTAQEYIRYRENRSRERERNTRINRQIEKVLTGESVQNSNANVDELSFSGKKFESANILHKSLALDVFARPEVSQAHRESRIYLHDLSEYDIGSHNCLFADVAKLLAEGFSTRNGDVRPANNFSTACQLVAVIFQCQSQVQFGGVASAHIDYDLAPYVRKSFYKHFADGLTYVSRLMPESVEAIMKYVKEQNLSIDNPYFNRYVEANQYARDMLKREGQQSAQALFHNLNTLESRAGSQVPFSSINMGLDTSAEGRLVTRWLLEASLDGIGKYHLTSIFPISIFVLKKGINDREGTPNYDLRQLAEKSLSKRIYPEQYWGFVMRMTLKIS